MSRTDISAASLADYLRRKCGDGSIEWCYEPMQTSVLLDIADMLDENAKLRKLVCRLDEAIALAYMMQVPPTIADVLIAHEEEVSDG